MPREFPGDPLVRTWCFHRWGPGSTPGWGAKNLQALRHGQEKKEKTHYVPGVLEARNTHHHHHFQKEYSTIALVPIW